MEIDCWLDKKFIDSLSDTGLLISREAVHLYGGTIVKAKPALQGTPERPAQPGRSAIPEILCPETGKILQKAKPSIPSKPKIKSNPQKKAVPGGQWFFVSSNDYFVLKEMGSRLRDYGYYPQKNLQLADEFANPFLHLQYVAGYWAPDSKAFRAAYSYCKNKHKKR